MVRQFTFLILCALFTFPVNAQIEHGMGNNWKSKKFRTAIRKEPDILKENHLKDSFLHLAVRLNRPKHLEILIKEKPEILSMLTRRNKDAQTSLELAIILNHFETFRILLRHLKNVNYRIWNQYHWTLMHLAARYNRPDFITLLAREGAAINAVDRTEDAWTPLDVAVHFGNTEATDVLRELGATFNALVDQTDDTIENPPIHEPNDIFHDAMADFDDDEEFGGFQMPLSDFLFGPMAIHLSVATFVIYILFTQVPFGS